MVHTAIVDNDIIQRRRLDIFFDGMHEINNLHSCRLSPLGHGIADINDFCIRFGQCFPHTLAEKIRNQTGIEVARTYDDVVRVDYGFTGTRVDHSFVPDKPGIYDVLIDVMGSFSGILGRNINELLSDYLRSVLKSDSQMNIFQSCRYDPSVHIEHSGEGIYCRLEIPGYVHKRRQEDIPDLIASDHS